jgi:hypothetical protein
MIHLRLDGNGSGRKSERTGVETGTCVGYKNSGRRFPGSGNLVLSNPTSNPKTGQETGGEKWVRVS